MPPFGLCTQTAKEFNKELSLDTSSVTDMASMFKVRTPLLPVPPLSYPKSFAFSLRL